MEHLDVLIVGAGLSGIGAGYHLATRCPGLTFALLEARDAIGGTWDLFRYPGVRSDSDMYTLSYPFHPWRGTRAIADGASIRDYIREAAHAHGLAARVRFLHRVTGAAWSSAEARWTVEMETGPERVPASLTCRFLYLCTGYYDYDRGHQPEWPGRERYGGVVVHPQHWPESLPLDGRRVVVVGSGATAVTLVPALAREAAHVTMLQRSPSFVVSRPSRDVVAELLARVLPLRLATAIARGRNAAVAGFWYEVARAFPTLMRRLLVWKAQQELGPGHAAAAQFNPRYAPWDERLCVAADGDLFLALRAGRAAVVTGEIETFTPMGVRLRSGEDLPADVVVTATGLSLKLLGGMQLVVDGERVDPARTLSYKGAMLSDVPNLAYAIGYTNASWTLKCDLTARWFCRVLEHMRASGQVRCTPRRNDPTLAEEPLLGLRSGYIRRALDRLPRQGSKRPWKLRQNYALDLVDLGLGRIDDGVLELR